MNLLTRCKWKLLTSAFCIGVLFQIALVCFNEYYTSRPSSHLSNTLVTSSLYSEALIMAHQENRNQTALLANMSKTIDILNERYAKQFNNSVSLKMWGTGKTIDMKNDYYPFVDFKFVSPKVVPKVNMTQKYFMMILVNTAAKGMKCRKRREAIRQTWGNQSNCEQRKALGDERLKNLRWLLVFVVGKAGSETNDDKLNMAEAKRHNDMLIGNIQDNYINNVIKFYMGQMWASLFDVKYTLKTDDDVYMRIPHILEYLVNAKFPRSFYGGASLPPSLVHRTIGFKWTVSWKYYSDSSFPSFNMGSFFILSSDLFNRLFNYVYVRRPFHLDDAYVGLAMRDANVDVTHISSFRMKSRRKQFISTIKDCEMLNYDGFGHSIDGELVTILHDRLQAHFCRKITVECSRINTIIA